MKKIFLLTAIIVLNFGVYAQKSKLTSSTFGSIEARAVGPAVMGGRISAIEGVNRTPRILYVGTAGGGIWKTTNGGSSFKAIFDKHPQSIGCLAIDQARPDTLWAGTGECNMRNSVSVGFGIFRSTDGGENWVKMGLDSTERISKIIIHPKDPNTIFVAVPGHLWNDNKDRGLYKTIDGGKTWQKILYIDDKTGCADVVMDPRNPDVLLASTWQFRRKPFAFSSGGTGSALYKSKDGGKTWQKITNGLPEGEVGRIALAMAPSAPDNMLAIVESKETGLFISSDNGDSWKKQSSTMNVTARPFYFSTLIIDPLDAKRVYRPALTFSTSIDGGYSFTEGNYGGGVHPDHHALWINPNNNSELWLGTDGGVYLSLDRGNSWRFMNNIPIGQFYHATTDNQVPYNVMGGLQDNGSWLAPSMGAGGISNRDWKELYGGDGFWVQPDLNNPDIVYAEYQGGNMARINRKNNEAIDIQPYPLAGEQKMRWNWNTPIVASPTNTKRLYTGSQYLYKTEDGGSSWTRLGGDLTTNDPAKQKQEEGGGLTVDNTSAENHCTIFTIAESPLDENTIYIGTDDGNIQLSIDAGKTFTSIAKNIPNIPAGTWVSSIEPSRFDKNTVYATFDNHAYGDMKTYLAKSVDMGKTWKFLANTTELKGYAHKIKEDLVNPKLLFLGTEWGLYISIDNGENWVQFKAKVPEYVAVRDITIQPRTNDLILATHGRSILIIDDISPLRTLDTTMNTDAILSSRPTPVTMGHYSGGSYGAGDWVGTNASEQATIMYYLKDRVTVGEVKVDIYDQNNKFLLSLPGTKRKGINKISWDMRTKPPRNAQGRMEMGEAGSFAGFIGPMASPGTYTAKLTAGNKVINGKVELVEDKSSTHSTADRELRAKVSDNLYKKIEDLAFLVAQVKSTQDTLTNRIEQIKNIKNKASLQQLYTKLEDLRKDLVPTKEVKGFAFTGEQRLRERLGELYYKVNSYEGRPTVSQIDRINGLEAELNKSQVQGFNLLEKDLPKLNILLIKEKLTPLQPLNRQTFDAQRSDSSKVGSDGK